MQEVTYNPNQTTGRFLHKSFSDQETVGWHIQNIEEKMSTTKIYTQ